MYKKCTCCVTSVLVVVVGVVVSLLLTVDWYAKSKEFMQCQMTCLERDVDTLRADIWDWKFLRYQICSQLTDAKNCSQPYSITVDSVDKKCTLSLQLNETNTEDFEIVYDESEKFRNATKEDLFIKVCIHVDYQYISETYLEEEHFYFEHRHTRFLYNNLLDVNIKSNHFYTTVNMNSKSILQEKYLLSFLTVCVLQLNYNNKTIVEDSWIVNVTDLIGVVSIGTDFFVQENVILTKGSKIYAWLSTLALVWFVFVILYLVQKMLVALHGFSETVSFTNCRLNGQDGRTLELTRPDVISVDSGDLNIFTSYFFSVLFRSDSFYKALIFTSLSVVWIYSMLAYFDNDLKPWFNFVSKSIFLCVLVICSVSFLILFPFAVIFLTNFAPIMIAPELMIHRWLRMIFPGLRFENANAFVDIYIVILLAVVCFALIYMFYYKDRMKDLLIRRDLVHTLLWLTWPVQLMVFLTKKYCPASTLNCVWIIIFSVLCFIGLFDIPFPEDQHLLCESFFYKRAKKLLAVAFWLFFPIYFALITFCRSYKRVISLAIEAVFTTLFVAEWMNFLLPWLYPSLKLMDSKQNEGLYLHIMLALHFVAYLLKIYRDCYTTYDKFLKDVISYVRDKYNCVENKKRFKADSDCIALIYNHLDKDDASECEHPRLSQGELENCKFKIKGLMLISKGSNIYAPSDFFFEVIKLSGGPGPIKSVIRHELFTLLFLRLFPALLIYWLVNVMYLVEFEKYDAVMKVVIGSAFISQYKELFLHRKVQTVDVKSNLVFQKQIRKFLENYETWFFVSEQL